MKFKGDIIITDPCYIMPKPNVKTVDRKDFGITDEMWCSPINDMTEEQKELLGKYREEMDRYHKEKDENDLWRNGKIDTFTGQGLSKFGFTNYLWGGTEYGDWSCTTVKDDERSQEMISKMNEHYLSFFTKYNQQGLSEETKKEMLQQYEQEREGFNKDNLILGNFCADAGLVGVFYLDEVLKLNPTFDYHINRLWTTTLIKDFDGDIQLTHRTVEGDREVSVIGKGNISFYTTQTGF